LMSRARRPFASADWRVMARYAASNDGWECMGFMARWGPFAQLHKQRTAKAWRDEYNRKIKEPFFVALIEKYRRRKESLNVQVGPSAATSSTLKQKRIIIPARRVIDQSSNRVQS